MSFTCDNLLAVSWQKADQAVRVARTGGTLSTETAKVVEAATKRAKESAAAIRDKRSA
jgi:hypothetical protein